MRDYLDAHALPPAGGLRRREFVRGLAGACLPVSTCGAQERRARLAGLDTAELHLARSEFDVIARAASLLELDARAAFVNVAINRRVVYALDAALAPGRDLWSTPFETLARGAGDCEDFAIAKFYLLIASGAPRDGVRLLYAIYRWPDLAARPQPHLVTVTGWPLADPCVLDSINPLVVRLSRRDDLEPLFSFDQFRIWPGVDATPLAGRRRRIDRWQATQARTVQQARQDTRDRRSTCPMFTEAPTARSTACIDRRRARAPSSSTATTWTSSAS